MNILIVDDRRDNLELLRDILATTEYDVLLAVDGKTAISLAQQKQPDLILLDVNMPGMSGFEVCRNLKQDSTTSHIPIIMLTAMADIDSRVYGLSIGADDYLEKPFSPRELIARVDRSLRAKTMADSMQQRQQLLRSMFERFVATPIVDQLISDPSLVKLGGQLQEVSVLFADLEGFTSVSETLEPERVLQLLNSYLALLVKIILNYGGTVDKFLGDGVIALYNTPVPQPDHVARAVKSALHVQDELYWFHRSLPDAISRMKINFGIHTGMAVVGNIGTDRIMDFTAVGDTVNVAARLQTVASGGQILVSRDVYQKTSDFVFGRSRGSYQVKGRRQPIETYEISNTFFE